MVRRGAASIFYSFGKGAIAERKFSGCALECYITKTKLWWSYILHHEANPDPSENPGLRSLRLLRIACWVVARGVTTSLLTRSEEVTVLDVDDVSIYIECSKNLLLNDKMYSRTWPLCDCSSRLG